MHTQLAVFILLINILITHVYTRKWLKASLRVKEKQFRLPFIARTSGLKADL